MEPRLNQILEAPERRACAQSFVRYHFGNGKGRVTMRSTILRHSRRGLALTVAGAAGVAMLALTTVGAQAEPLPVRDTVCHEDRKPGVVYFATRWL